MIIAADVDDFEIRKSKHSMIHSIESIVNIREISVALSFFTLQVTSGHRNFVHNNIILAQYKKCNLYKH